jgi:hypothetical protein
MTRTMTGEVDGNSFVAQLFEFRNKEVPTPGTVICTVDKYEAHETLSVSVPTGTATLVFVGTLGVCCVLKVGLD